MTIYVHFNGLSEFHEFLTNVVSQDTDAGPLDMNDIHAVQPNDVVPVDTNQLKTGTRTAPVKTKQTKPAKKPISKERILQMYKEELSQVQIAAALGCTPSYVSLVLKEAKKK